MYSHLMIASIISWLSKQSKVSAIVFLVLARMRRLGRGVMNWEVRSRKSKTMRCQEWNYLMNRFNAWTMRVSSGLYGLCQRMVRGKVQLLTIASMISWLSKQSMAIAMFLILARMCRLGDGAVHWDFRIRKSKTIGSQEWNYLVNRFSAWTIRVSSGLFEEILTIDLMISWLSKQSMVIAMFLVPVRIRRFGHGVMNWELRITKSKSIRSQEIIYLMNRFNAWIMQVSSCVGKRHFSVVCVCILICYGCELCLEKACMRNAYFKR